MNNAFMLGMEAGILFDLLWTTVLPLWAMRSNSLFIRSMGWLVIVGAVGLAGFLTYASITSPNLVYWGIHRYIPVVVLIYLIWPKGKSENEDVLQVQG